MVYLGSIQSVVLTGNIQRLRNDLVLKVGKYMKGLLLIGPVLNISN